MLFLVTGASGVGKSTVRELVAPQLGDMFEAVELKDLGPVDEVTLAWRQEMAEVAAARAAGLNAAGRHLLLSGDPVAAGEVIAAPSAVRCGGVAVCLLDASEEAHRTRLARRGDPFELLPLHIAYAQWMREHAVDPLPGMHVLTSDGAPGMQWERLEAAADLPQRWHMHVVDTSEAPPDDVAARVCEWINSALTDELLVMHPEHWQGQA